MADQLEEIKKLASDINQMVEKGNEQAKLAIEEKGKAIDAALKTELKNALDAHTELVQKQTQEQFDALQTQIKKSGGFGNNRPESFGDLVAKELEANKGKLSTKSPFELEFDRKAVGDMTTGVNLGAGVLQPSLQPGIINRQAYFNHVRDFLTVRPTTSPVIAYVRENGGEGSFTTVAEGALKPQVDYDLSYQTTNVKKIAGHIRISEEMIEDVPYITNYITTRGAEDLRLVEDAQILYGDGTGQNLRGITLDASAFARPAGMGTVANANNVDVIRAVMAQIRVGRYAASAVMLNPVDVAILEMAKDTQGAYLYSNFTNENSIPRIWGLPIIVSDSVTAGSFLVGDFRNGAELFDRQALNVRFYDQDRDNAIRNMVTIVIEERLALANIRPASFVTGTFTAAKAALAAA
ncbi:phage major capsid protein [Rufibacter roseus]|uniref:Phage major capsid protein n=1 Tax=Rufibacter roseus TaxID=1567108 RepID=A0ABW2DK66_9BACT|nr:phage major capsid protein [Rufibacter roseus]